MPAASGTWDGPAPRGTAAFAPGEYYTKDRTETTFDASKEPRTMPLPGGAKFPLLACAPPHAALALERGVRHVRCGADDDKAALKAAGEAIRSVGRADVFVSAKLPAHRHLDPRACLEETLAALGLDHLDMFSLEWPVATSGKGGESVEAPKMEETWALMEALVTDGLARFAGVTNFSVPQVERVGRCAQKVKPAVNECELHPLLSQRKLVGVCRRFGLVLAAHTPLAQGAKELLTHAAVDSVCKSSGRSKEEVLVRWSLQRGVAATLGPDTPEDVVKRVADGVFRFRLTHAEKAELDAVEVRGQELRTFNPPFNFVWDDAFLGGAARPGLSLEQTGQIA